MNIIRIDRDIMDYLQSRTNGQDDTPAAVLRRELQVPQPQVTLEIDDDTYAFIVAKARGIGESASNILRRELHLSGGGQEPGEPGSPGAVSFTIPAGTGAGAWNTRETMLVAKRGDTLRLTNADSVPHRLHTSGRPFPHPSADLQPGGSIDLLLQTTFDPDADGVLYDHLHGQTAQFWLRVKESD